MLEALIQIMSVGRGLDPADPVPVFDWYVEWNYLPYIHEKHAAKKRNVIPFNRPGRFHYVIGGVKIPPYEMVL